jgi:2,3-bisphosphoglycerate-independent phosphoglycerate mutase
VTDKLVDAIEGGKYDVIICNYANADMVGHTGNLEATVQAIETIDHCLGRIAKALHRCGGEMLITADHGNAEQMLDRRTEQAHTAHTGNLVPLIYVGREARLAETAALCDVAPTLLQVMGLTPPPEMTGRALLSYPESET